MNIFNNTLLNYKKYTQQQYLILQEFRRLNIRLSNEIIFNNNNNNYNDNLNINDGYIQIIPEGQKAFAWFIKDEKTEQPTCFILYVKGNTTFVEQIEIKKCIFDKSLCYSTQESIGTLIYVTIIQIPLDKTNNIIENTNTICFMTIEDIYIYKGKNTTFMNWEQKNNICISIFEMGDIAIKAYSNEFIIFGMPILINNIDNLFKYINNMNIKSYSISIILYKKYTAIRNSFNLSKQFIIFNENNKQTNIVQPLLNNIINTKINIINTKINNQHNNQQNYQQNYQHNNQHNNQQNYQYNYQHNYQQNNKINNQQKNKINNQQNNKYNNKINKIEIFEVCADIQNEIYHLYNNNNEWIDYACIPDIKTSFYMNSLFRKIKENNNLDALEESDDEEEFNDIRNDKYVFLDRKIKMQCIMHKRHHRWVPLIINK